MNENALYSRHNLLNSQQDAICEWLIACLRLETLQCQRPWTGITIAFSSPPARSGRTRGHLGPRRYRLRSDDSENRPVTLPRRELASKTVGRRSPKFRIESAPFGVKHESRSESESRHSVPRQLPTPGVEAAAIDARRGSTKIGGPSRSKPHPLERSGRTALNLRMCRRIDSIAGSATRRSRAASTASFRPGHF